MPALTSTAQPKWISPAKAVQYIESHTHENPSVNLGLMLGGYELIKKGFNFNIFMVGKQNGRLVDMGVIPCHIETEFDAIAMKEALKTAYRKEKGREYDETPVRAVDNVAQPDRVMSASSAGRNRKKTTPRTQKGAVMEVGDASKGTSVTSMAEATGVLGGLDK